MWEEGEGEGDLVGVFDAEEEESFRLFGKEEVEEGRAKTPQVETSRGARRVSDADLLWCCVWWRGGRGSRRRRSGRSVLRELCVVVLRAGVAQGGSREAQGAREAKGKERGPSHETERSPCSQQHRGRHLCHEKN